MLYRNTVGADKDAIRAIQKRITEACPDVRFFVGDYGLRLEGWRIDAEGATIPRTTMCVCQPHRPDTGQPEIIADVDALIAFWRT